jgi:exopolysaccharide biosynthesis WecB/TagA/CpsF family protein
VINVPDQRYLIDRLLEDAAEAHGGTVFTVNLDHFSKLQTDPEFRSAYERADYVTADGMPVVMLARAEGVAIERVTGADLVRPLVEAAAGAGLPVHFFGAEDTVLDRAIERLRVTAPDLLVAGREAPPMGFDPTGEAATAAARRIAASGARFCFVALGAPKQEIFARHAVVEAPGTIFLGVGAALEFIAGTRKRAPAFVQAMCLEWFWRMMQEPRRLAPRYWRSFRWLAGHVARDLLGLSDRPETGEGDVHVVLQVGRRVHSAR